MLQNYESASQGIFLSLERRLGRQTLDTWFRPLTFRPLPTERVVKIAAPNAVVRDWIVAHYSAALQDSLTEQQLDHYRIEWLLPSASKPDPPPTSPDVVQRSRSHGATASEETSGPYVEPAPTSLNARYTFSTFVVAPCNRFAHAAAKAVTEMPGKTYNPLYLYGGVGLGKTHLIQAVGHAVKSARPELEVAYLSLERFMNELINAIRYGYDKTRDFRERYRSIDLLLIDDIQFIAGKERTQEEFFHTFNALYDGQKQIVLTSDCPPREIPELEERLHSRFEWGLIADIEPPDLETKVAILTRKAEMHHITLPDDVALFLASNTKHNIRELEGALVRVLAIASLRGAPLSKSLAQDAMRNVTQAREDNTVTVAMVQKTVADYFKITVDDLRARSNMRQVLVPRQVAMYLCKKLTKKSYPEIARQFGGKHHTTVIHSVEKIEQMITTDREMQTAVRRLTESIGV
jgi:chromosomal replication initiator protein